MNKDVILGYLADELGGYETQEDVNENSIKIYNYRSLIEIVPKHVSKPVLDSIIEETDISFIELWEFILNKLVENYSLDQLEFYDTNWKKSDTFGKDISDILIFIKVKMMNFILEDKLNKEMNVSEVQLLFEKESAPEPLKWVLGYLSRDSFTEFLTTVFTEYNDSIEEIVVY